MVAVPVATRWPQVEDETANALPLSVALSCVITPVVGVLVPVKDSGILSAAPPETRVNVEPTGGVLMTTLGGGCTALTTKVVEVDTVTPALTPVTTRVCEPAETFVNVPVLTAVAVPNPAVEPTTTGLPSSEALTLFTTNPFLDVVVKV
jgi:hypothetical protein